MSQRSGGGSRQDAEVTYKLLYEQTKRTLDQREAEIAHLELITQKGKVQRELQLAAKQYRDLQGHLADLEAKTQRDEEAKDDFKQQIFERDAQIENLKQEVSSDAQLLSELAANRDDYKQDVELLEEKLAEVEDENKDLKQDLSDARKTIDTKQTELIKMEQQLQKFKDGAFVAEKDQEIALLRMRVQEMGLFHVSSFWRGRVACRLWGCVGVPPLFSRHCICAVVCVCVVCALRRRKGQVEVATRGSGRGTWRSRRAPSGR